MLFFLSYIKAAGIRGHFRSATRLEDEKDIYTTSAACDTFSGDNKEKTKCMCVSAHMIENRIIQTYCLTSKRCHG